MDFIFFICLFFVALAIAMAFVPLLNGFGVASLWASFCTWGLKECVRAIHYDQKLVPASNVLRAVSYFFVGLKYEAICLVCGKTLGIIVVLLWGIVWFFLVEYLLKGVSYLILHIVYFFKKPF